MMDALPPTWALASLEQILTPLEDGRLLHHGWSPQCDKEPAGSDDEWGVLKTTAIQPGAFLPEHNKRLPPHLTPRPQHEVKVGDLLITCAGPRVRCGIPCLVKNTRPKLMLSGKMYRFRVPEDFVDAAYVEKYLLSQKAQLAIDSMKTGGSDSGLNLTHDRFKPLPVPLAPINEQRRIASKIDELFSRIDEGERALRLMQKLVARYREAVLKAAVTGELTREWRNENWDKLESGQALVVRLLRARREAWELAEMEKMKAQGTTPPNDKWKQKYEEPSPPDTTELSVLPQGWAWVSLDQLICDGPTNGYSPKTEPDATGTLSLKLTATTYGHLRLDEDAVKRLQENMSADSPYLLKAGDILIQRANSLEHVGTAVIFDGPESTYVYPDLMMRVRSWDSALRSWLCRYINFGTARRYFRERATGTAGSMPKINSKTVRSLPVPLPPLDELTMAISRLEELESEVRTAEKGIDLQLASSASLRAVVLREAFSGRLLRQHPNDEPASTLLERMAAERGAHNAAFRRAGNRNHTS